MENKSVFAVAKLDNTPYTVWIRPEKHGKRLHPIGGKIEVGEAPKDALLREIREELGINPQNVVALPYRLTRTVTYEDGQTWDETYIPVILKVEPTRVEALRVSYGVLRAMTGTDLTGAGFAARELMKLWRCIRC